jgi:hypothetical protein
VENIHKRDKPESEVGCLTQLRNGKAQEGAGPHSLPPSPQGRVAHAEAGAHVFGQQFDGGTIGNRVRLCQILHGFHQKTLAIYVARVLSTFTFFAAKIWRDRNSKNFSHEYLSLTVSEQYIVPVSILQLDSRVAH